MTNDGRKKKLRGDGLTDGEIKGGTFEVFYERAQCEISLTKPEDTLFGGLSDKDMDELFEYMIPEQLPDGTVFSPTRKPRNV